MRNSEMFVLTTEPGGKPIAAAVYGSSGICRQNNPLAGGYIIVRKDYRKQGIGDSLFTLLEQELEKRGFEGFLTDVFPHCVESLLAMLRRGYHVTGSLPRVAYVKGQGLSHSLVLYKDFRTHQNYLTPDHQHA